MSYITYPHPFALSKFGTKGLADWQQRPSLRPLIDKNEVSYAGLAATASIAGPAASDFGALQQNIQTIKTTKKLRGNQARGPP
jgi:hypothetical protein